MTHLEILYFIAYHSLSFDFVVVWFSPEQPFTSGLFCSVEAINDCESITGSFKIKVLFAYNIEQELEAQDIFYTSSKHYATLSIRASDQSRERLQMLQCLVLYANIVCTSVGHCKTSEYTPSPPHNVSHPVYKHTIFINAPSFTSPWAYYFLLVPSWHKLRGWRDIKWRHGAPMGVPATLQ
jgi:hypothetical protein